MADVVLQDRSTDSCSRAGNGTDCARFTGSLGDSAWDRGQRSVEGNGFTYLGFNSKAVVLQELSAPVLQPPQQELSWTRVGRHRKGANPALRVWIYPLERLH